MGFSKVTALDATTPRAAWVVSRGRALHDPPGASQFVKPGCAFC